MSLTTLNVGCSRLPAFGVAVGLAVRHYVTTCRTGSQDDEAQPLDTMLVELCLWTLNPAIAFRDVAANTHSVILTSGTLAPLNSFASEARTK